MKILCPTDFSKHSRTALEYAVNLANDLHAELHIISVYQVDKSVGSYMSMDSLIHKNVEEDMEKLIAELSPMIIGDNKPVSRIVRGDTINTLLRYSEQIGIDLLVMGTQGSRSLRTRLFGSTTRKMAQKSKVAILAIPEVVAHRITSNKLLMALDDKALKGESVFRIPRYIAQKLQLKIDLLHIVSNDEEIPFDPFISEYLGDTIGEIHLSAGQNPVVAIKKFVEKENVGILMMIRRDKTFWNRLFEQSNTSEEIAKTDIPLLILPE